MTHPHMPPLVLDAAAVARHLPSVDVVAALRVMFADLGRGDAIQPPQTLTLLPGEAGDFITYLGAIAGARVFGAKLSPYIVTPGAPIITAWTTLMSMDTGQPLLLCDSGQLTTERTAGTTALAVDCLAPAGASVLAIIGSGKVALAHLRHVLPLRTWREVRVYSRRLNGNAERQAEWAQFAPNVIFAESAEAAAMGAEVVMLCTSSGKPVIEAAAIAPGALVTSISTNVANAHEIAPGFLVGAEVYCDYHATTPASAGEMKLATTDHSWSSDALRGDLAGLVAGTCARPSGGKPVFFRSIGLGLEDVCMAHAIWRVATH